MSSGDSPVSSSPRGWAYRWTGFHVLGKLWSSLHTKSPLSSPRGRAFKRLIKIGGVTKAGPRLAVLSLEGTPDLCYHTGKAMRTQLEEILVGNQTRCSAFQLPEAGGSRSPVDATQPACGILSKLNGVPENVTGTSSQAA